MLRASYFSIIFLLVMACSEDAPPERWNEQEAVHILADLHIIHAALKQVKRDSADAKETEHMNYLLNLYDLDQNELNAIVNYAQSDPERAALLYEEVVSRLDSIIENNDASLKKKI